MTSQVVDWMLDPLPVGTVEGVALYEWANQRQRTSRQVLRVLAQLARALEATHRAGCVHRDVKGDNVLVSAEGRAFLMDFGAGKFKGAPQLTYGLMPPGTAQYRSPQAQRFQWAYRLQRGLSYEATEADDVYALGVTAYCLVTGSYPPPEFDLARAVDPTRPPQPALRPPRERVTVSRELDGLIMRMMSDAPEERGNMPNRPFKGQVLPPCKGVETEIELTPGRKDTRSCWLKIDAAAEKCQVNGYEYRGGCYMPSLQPPKLPQSIGP